MNINKNNIDKISINDIVLKKDLEENLIQDFNRSKYVGLMKFSKDYRVLIFYEDGNIDTIYSNGYAHIIKSEGKYSKAYSSDENLIEKYSR